MKCNAITVANELIEAAREDGSHVTPLRLMKLTYISYGFGLALLEDGVNMIDGRFDRVEAWRLGPVIPSVYHTFKHYGNTAIERLGEVAVDANEDCETAVFETPRLGDSDDDKNRRKIIRYVWRRYKRMSARDLVDILHQDGTPWKLSYRPGMNCEIPEWVTKRYYDILVDNIYDGIKRRKAGGDN